MYRVYGDSDARGTANVPGVYVLDLSSLRRQGYRPEAVTSESSEVKSSYVCNGVLPKIGQDITVW